MAEDSPANAQEVRAARRLWLILPAVLLGVAAVAVAAYFLEPRETVVSGFAATSQQPLFPGLEERIEDVSAIEIETTGQQLRLARDGRHWTVEQKGGYPALDEVVHDFLRSFASLRSAYVAKETRQAGPQFADERSTDAYRVRLINAKGEEVANARFGHAITVPAGEVRTHMPVRAEPDPELRLAAPVLRVETSSGAWLDRRILSVPRGGVAEFASVSAQGERVELREQAAPPPAQREQIGRRTEDDALAAVSRAVEELVFDDVRPAEELPQNLASAGHADVRTHDGVAYRIELRGSEEETWATVSAQPGASGGSEEVSARAQAFSERHKRWAYRLPTHVVDSLTVRAGDLAE